MQLRVLAIVALLGGVAHADARVDWARGLVIADGIGVADRHAPSAEVARGTSRRAAERAAAGKIEAAIAGIPWAGGGTVGEKLADAGVKARVEKAIAAAIDVDAEPDTDGSWRVTRGVPLEAIRQAIGDGPRAATSDADAPVVIVDGVKGAPALGVEIGGVSGAVLWCKEIPAWAKGAPHVKAKKRDGAKIEVAAPKAGPATLFVVRV
ncbi:MAG TPA: hypothetical protein VGM88_24695 [Kofleriaceae bacterium]|jgi:hypothetical protein